MSSKKWSGSRSLDIYLKEINDIPLIKREEEKELAKKIRKGDEEAFHKFIKANLRFVISVAKNYVNQGLSLADLINEGNIGLIKAAGRFDEKRGFKFISYAVWWIRQAILQALAEQSRIVRLPLNRAGKVYQIGKISRQLDQELQRKPEADEIAEKLGISVDEVRETQKIANSHLSFDASYNNDSEENNLSELLEDENTPLPDKKTYRNSLSKDMEKVLKTLKEREKAIIIMYFGLGGQEPLTLEEIGRKMDLTRERIRQIKEKAILRLRQATRKEFLRPYLEDIN
ncbi:MAG: RNA polymerase sigma factor RpoD/SigA [Patescibacteria group bacterium]|nr:RNA polymerase sigma factor RpoD/SigA [Patescibacteria group bacterium]